MELQTIIPMLGGLFIIVGGIFLLNKGKLSSSSDGKAALTFTFPGGASINAVSTALGLFVVGAALLLIPYWLDYKWRKESGELTQENNRLKQENHRLKAEAFKTVTIQGPVKAEGFPVVIYAAGKQTALQTIGEYNLRVPVYSNMDDYDIIYTMGQNIYTTMRVSATKLLDLNVPTLRMNEISFPANDTSGMLKDKTAYNTLESSALNQSLPAGYEQFPSN